MTGLDPGSHVDPRPAAVPAYAAVAFLAEGTVVEVRSVSPVHEAAVVDLHARASDESIRRRFFALNRREAVRYAQHMCSPDGRSIGLVAMLRGEVIGVVGAERDGPDSVEVALLVDEERHGVGIGTLLLEHLAAWTLGQGIDNFHAEVLTENIPMLRVFRDAGFELVQCHDHDVVTVTLDVRPSSRTQDAADRRERQAEAASVHHLLEPESVAVVGVSRHRRGVGREILENIVAGGFAGRIYAVGQRGLSISGAEGCADVASLPQGLDLAIVAVPAARVVATVEALAARGVRSCVIVTSGLGETGLAGRRAEQEVAKIARRAGMRLVGPNCFGIISRLRNTRLDATFGTQHAPSGRLAIGSQSGGVGIAVLARAHQRSLGLAAFVSLGNKLDISGNDLLAAWEDDVDIDVAALYLESFGNPAKFVRLATSFGRHKPLLAVFGGTSTAGSRAGASHTAASVTPKRALDAVLRAAGVVRVSGLADLVDTAALLAEQPLPGGPRVAIASNAGGMGVLAADAALEAALEVPMFGPELQDRIRAGCPGISGTSNPVDLGAGAAPASFAGTVASLLDSSEVDAVVVVVAATAVAESAEVVAAVDTAVGRGRAADGCPDKPCLLVVVGGDAAPPGALTSFETVDSAIASLRHAATYATWRRSLDDSPAATPVDPPRTGKRRPQWAPPAQKGWLAAESASSLLADYGLSIVPQEIVPDPDAAVMTADRLGYPVVVKSADPQQVHKVERHLVRVSLLDEFAVRQAATSVQAAAPGPLLVQKQLVGAEIALGIVRDVGFGPLVMVASGGTNLSLWDDQTFLLPPFRETDVLAALRSLRTWPLLAGYRGSEPVDTRALARDAVQLGRLAVEWPQVAELDVNPVIVTTGGAYCVDVKLRWAPDEDVPVS